MKNHYEVPRSWNELTPWQVEEIAHIYLNTNPKQFQIAYHEMLFVLFQGENTRKAKRRLTRLISKNLITDLEPFGKFILEQQNYYKFPEIEGLIKPADRLTNITIRQFSTIDTFFFQWNTQRITDKNNEVLLNRLVAALYRISETYSDLELAAVNAITSKISTKQKESIALSYLFTRQHIVNQFPIVFPKKEPESEDTLTPKFESKASAYVPFDRAIIAMAMEELQPLGKKQDVDKVLIYEFFSVLSENIRIHSERAKAINKK